jgi:DNA-directed RNA polymerase-3 subunit RPC5
MAENDPSRPVAVLPVYFSDELDPDLHLHQFPLQARALQVPPSAELAGKPIKARYKPNSRRTEMQVPLDVRADVWNAERGVQLGEARAESDLPRPSGDAGRNVPASSLPSISGQRLNELRLRSEHVPGNASYAIGVLKDNAIYLHPVAQVHQFKPSLNYLDVISSKSARARGAGDSDSDEDDGPPLDPDEPPPPPAPEKKKEKKGSEAKEVTVVVKKTDEKGGIQFQGGLSNARREMLAALRKEDEEPWQDLQYCHPEVCSLPVSLLIGSSTLAVCGIS